jgi:hypothetical protein
VGKIIDREMQRELAIPTVRKGLQAMFQRRQRQRGEER